MLGSTLSRIFKNGLNSFSYPFNFLNFEAKGKTVDPLVCAYGALFGVLAMWFALFTIGKIMIIGWIFIFIAIVFICLGFAITTDIILVIFFYNKFLFYFYLLYVIFWIIFFTTLIKYVTPSTRHSTAIAIQTLFTHLFGDAISPYIIGLISDIFCHDKKSSIDHFIALQYALFIPNLVLILAGVFYIEASKFIEKDSDNEIIICMFIFIRIMNFFAIFGINVKIEMHN